MKTKITRDEAMALRDKYLTTEHLRLHTRETEAIMEALASGLPVIASNLSGIPELIRPQQTGYLIPPGDSRALADSIAYVYHHPSRSHRYARAGKKLVREEFNIQSSVKKLKKLFLTHNADLRQGASTSLPLRVNQFVTPQSDIPQGKSRWN